nr:MAG TPA: hypothetical protein [Caudoviricetes sp.]
MTYDEITKIMCKVHDPKEVALNKAFSYGVYIIQTLKEITAEVARICGDMRSTHICEPDDVRNFINKYCFISRAGDYTGSNNRVLNFGYGGNNMDIAQALTTILGLYAFAYDEEDNDNANE